MLKMEPAITYKTESLRAGRNLKNYVRPYGITTLFQERRTDKLAGLILGEMILSGGHLKFSPSYPPSWDSWGEFQFLGGPLFQYLIVKGRGTSVSLQNSLIPARSATPRPQSITLPSKCAWWKHDHSNKMCSVTEHIIRKILFFWVSNPERGHDPSPLVSSEPPTSIFLSMNVWGKN